jgi:hypothetical protein
VVERRFIEVRDPDGGARWRVDAGFLTSGWRCRWGDGCQGIEDEPAPSLHRGCCSVGAVLADTDEAMTVAALAACLPPERFQFHDEASRHGVLAGDGRAATRVVDGACIFLNRPGFAGGMGCALHLQALADGDDPDELKPAVCSRLPLRVQEGRDDDGARHELRAWRRDDWGPGGATMAWWCVDAPECYDAPTPVIDRLAGPLRTLLGDGLYGEVRHRLGLDDPLS